MKSDFKEEWLIRTALIAVAVVLLLRFIPALWGSLALFAGFALVIGGIYLVYRFFFSVKDLHGGEKDEFQLRIAEQMEVCKHKADRYRTEANEIRQSHRELADQLEISERSLQDNAREKARKVLTNLDSELGLRLAKANFFEASYQRLAEMLEAHKLHRKLKQSEEKLEGWRSENYVDIDGMEAMKDRIEREKTQLDTISSLTHRAAITEDLDHTERLLQQLKAIIDR